MNNKIKIIIADDNIWICDILEKFLKKYEDIEILGVAHTDQEEVDLINSLNPDIVITDLMRNHKYTGLDIIKEYSTKTDSPKFFVITAYVDENIMRNNLAIAGYIKKPFIDYNIIIQELRRIKEDIEKEKIQLIVRETEAIAKIGIFARLINSFKMRR